MISKIKLQKNYIWNTILSSFNSYFINLVFAHSTQDVELLLYYKDCDESGECKDEYIVGFSSTTCTVLYTTDTE